jgi:hypothetical protein
MLDVRSVRWQAEVAGAMRDLAMIGKEILAVAHVEEEQERERLTWTFLKAPI